MENFTENNETGSLENYLNGTMVRPNIDPTLKKSLDILLIIIMAIVMLSLGCTVELATVKKELRRPVGIGIGMFCQFILFPPVAFGLAHALALTQWDALGMIMLGTCPGGHISNIATYWSDGDVALSVSMTAASTAIGTGMMPLNLWIYSRSWTDQTAVIPYINIVITLVSILVPVAIGAGILLKFPKAARWIARIGSLLGFLVIVAAVVMICLINVRMFTSSWRVWIGAALLPVCGLLVGYALALITRRSVPQRRAISIETSAQNVAFCILVITVSFDSVIGPLIVLFPSIFSIFTTVTLLVVSAMFRLSDFISTKTYDLVQKDVEGKGRSVK